MKKIILSITLLSLMLILVGCSNIGQTTNSSSKENEIKSTTSLWASLNETTWWKDNEWAGESYVFYIDNNGIKKCIHQVHGSGVYVISRRFVDFEIIDDRNIKFENEVYRLNDDKFVSKNSTLSLHDTKALVYNRIGLLDMDIVKSNEFVVKDIDKSYNNQKR